MARLEHYAFHRGAAKLALGTAILLTMGFWCTVQEQGDINVTIVRAVARNGQLCPITSINWAVDPINVPPRASGSPVGTTAIPAMWKNYSGGMGQPSNVDPRFPFACQHTDTFAGLANGTWAVTGKDARGRAFSCNRTVHGDVTTIVWVFNEAGTLEKCM